MELSSHLHAPAALLLGKRPPVPIVQGGWVATSVGMDALGTSKIACPAEISNPVSRSSSLWHQYISENVYYNYESVESVTFGTCWLKINI
jgi:hypothetical protein